MNEGLNLLIKYTTQTIGWCKISQHEKLSEDFIREFQDYVSWIYVSQYQTLSEPFIREFQDRVEWVYISRKHQTLSDTFLEEFYDRLGLQPLSPIFHKHKLSEDMRAI